MPVLNIKDKETHALATQLARLSHQTMSQAVKEALQDKLAQLDSQGKDRYRLVARVKELAAAASASPTLDRRTPDEIIGYDEIGVPR